MTQQIHKQLELGAREPRLLATATHPTCEQVHLDVARHVSVPAVDCAARRSWTLTLAASSASEKGLTR